MTKAEGEALRPRKKFTSKVKTGCQTCRTRRVKCDETWPSCKRCLSTRRCCDGYGIWGGGGATLNAVVAPRKQLALLMGEPQSHERRAFYRFQERTVQKIPGVFGSLFWTTYVLQACHQEPAVFHAAVALAAFHEIGRNTQAMLGLKGRFALKHYSNAIECLQPYFTAENHSTDSYRTILVVCILFVCIEQVRGDSSTANRHLQSGLKVLADLLKSAKGLSCHNQNEGESLESSIFGIFYRLDLQYSLYAKQTLSLNTLRSENNEIPVCFSTVGQARKYLDVICQEVLSLVYGAGGDNNKSPNIQTLELCILKSKLQSNFTRWVLAYKAFKKKQGFYTEYKTTIACHILELYQTMFGIMINTCLNPDKAYDAYLEDFSLILRQCQSFKKIVFSPELSRTQFRHGSDVPYSIDMGWIPPLYYTAVNCHRYDIRIQAIRLLESVSSQEGMWSALHAAEHARALVFPENYYALSQELAL